jgi:hypothetical protein
MPTSQTADTLQKRTRETRDTMMALSELKASSVVPSYRSGRCGNVVSDTAFGS